MRIHAHTHPPIPLYRTVGFGAVPRVDDVVPNPMFDQVRGLVVAGSAGLGADQFVHVIAQTVPAVSDLQLMQIAEKGGGWAVLLIVLFFYRRDFLRKADNEHAANDRLMQAITKQADSETKLAVALAENTEVMRRVIEIAESRR